MKTRVLTFSLFSFLLFAGCPGESDTEDTSSCSDGIQNGDETDVDCGGSCSPCDNNQVETCTDEILNQDETGVDCGGPNCTACEPASSCDDEIMNGDEDGIDCGGGCEPCITASSCGACLPGEGCVEQQCEGIVPNQVVLPDNYLNTEAFGQQRFGSTIDFNNNWLVAGAFGDDACEKGVNPTVEERTCPNDGAVYIFKRENEDWSFHTLIKPPGRSGFFGGDVSLDGDRLVVGCSLCGFEIDEDRSTGAAYLYELSNNTWTLAYTFESSNLEPGDAFGGNVLIQQDLVVIGASGEDSCTEAAPSNNDCPGAGAAYVFQENGLIWDEVAYLKSADEDTSEFFGEDIHISGDNQTIFIGRASKSGKVATFVRSNSAWVRGETITPNSEDELFGWRLDIKGNQLFVSGEATAYLYEKNASEWILKQTFDIPGAVDFGGDIALIGDLAFTSEPNSNYCGEGVETQTSQEFSCERRGIVTAYRNDGDVWYREMIISAETSINDRAYGAYLDTHDDKLVIGSLNSNNIEVFDF